MGTDVTRHRFTVEDYHEMGRVGILHEDDRVELIEGEIVEMSPIGSEHAACVKRLNQRLNRLLEDQAVVGVQDPVRIDRRSEPEPDLTVLRPRQDFYAAGHPGPEDVMLLVEVADATLDYDRGVKLPLYARAGIPEVWLVDLETNVVEVHRQPNYESYKDMEPYQRGDAVVPEAFPERSLPVEGILGPA